MPLSAYILSISASTSGAEPRKLSANAHTHWRVEESLDLDGARLDPPAALDQSLRSPDPGRPIERICLELGHGGIFGDTLLIAGLEAILLAEPCPRLRHLLQRLVRGVQHHGRAHSDDAVLHLEQEGIRGLHPVVAARHLDLVVPEL